MKYAIAVALLAAGLQAAERPAPGDPAPAFDLATTSGGRARLEDYHVRKLVLAFFPKAFTGG